MEEKYYHITFNPTAFDDFEKAYIKDKQNINSNTIFGAFCWPQIDYSIDAIYKRYKELDNNEIKIKVVLAEKELLDKFIWPLRQAKVTYMLGNFLGTIALCGFISEMIIQFIYKVSEVRINKNPITLENENDLFGDTFERLHSQDRCIRILNILDIIDDKFKEKCLFIKDTRNKHIHSYYEQHDKIQNYAKRVYIDTTYITSIIMGQDISKNGIILKEHIIKYLKQKEESQKD